MKLKMCKKIVKRKYLRFFFLSCIALFIGVLGIIFFNKEQLKNNSDLINISELSDEFMKSYYKGTAEILSYNNPDNVIFIVTKKHIANSYGAQKVVSAPNNTYILQYENTIDKEKAMTEFKKDKEIFSVTENKEYTFTEETLGNESYNSWGIEKMGLDYASNMINSADPTTISDITVAIIDTGCDMTNFNNSFNGKIVNTLNLYSDNLTDEERKDVTNMYDGFGHGTHIAGTIAEGTPNNVKIMPIKVSDQASLTTTLILAAINYITTNHAADIINMSFGGPINDNELIDYNEDPEYLAIEAANEEGIISVAASGNTGLTEYHYPASFDNTVSVAAVDQNLNLATFSTMNDKITYSAPGVNILSINGTMNGTSMATPHVVSAISILKSLQKNISFEDTINILNDHLIDLGKKGYDKQFGNGFITFKDVQICSSPQTQSCDELNIFRKIIPDDIEIVNPKLTSYNYGSLTNILDTEIKIISTDETYEIKKLWELDDLEISGYDPYSKEEQTINVKYNTFTTSFNITNPSNQDKITNIKII